MQALLERATQFEADLIALRRHFHQHPELSFREVQTAAEVARQMAALGCHVQRGVGKTGVVAELGSGSPVVALRADMDALPIQETNNVDYRSTSAGIMHACGHDAHMSMLVGAARLLVDAQRRGELPPGTVRLLFQPSEECSDEENKSGARRMIEDGALKNVQAVFGLHVGGHLESGKFFLSPGPIMAGTDTFEITIRGQSAHAARPQEGIDAVVLAAHVVLACQAIMSRRISPFDEGVLSIGMVRGGVAENVIADRVELRGTLRYFNELVRDTIRRELAKAVDLATVLGGQGELRLKDGYPPVVNDPAMTEVARRAVVSTVGVAVVAEFEPMMGAEDFALMLQQTPGAFLWLGAAPGKPREHHHPQFNIDERVLVQGASVLAATAMEAMRRV